MTAPDRFKITYIGGGSQFLVPFLNGLASVAEALKELGRPIELSLLDLDLEKAGRNVRYAELVARCTGLTLSASATDDRRAALDGSDWLMFGIGRRQEWLEVWERWKPRLLNDQETGPFTAIEAAVYWPWVRRFAADAQRLCPGALFCTLVNPPDVLAPAAGKAFSLPAVGLCVEVPQLQHWLAYYLRAPYSEINIEYLGLNHLGWVSQWTVSGRDGAPLLTAALPERTKDETWQPRTDWFVDAFRATGYMRTGPYHPWPYLREWTKERILQRSESGRALKRLRPTRVLCVEDALERGELIPEAPAEEVHPGATSYLYPSVRHTFGAMAVGLAGGSAGPVPIQARNGGANPWMPPDAWLEAPTRIENSRVLPQIVPRLPDPMVAELETVARQRMLLTDWLVTGNPDLLKQAMFLWPNVTSTESLLALCDDLSGRLKTNAEQFGTPNI